MIIKRSVVQKENSVLIEFVMYLFPVLLFFVIMFFVMNSFPRNDFSKDIVVADFRLDVNMLMEASNIIESKRTDNPNSKWHEYGTTGKLLKSDEINQNLKRMLLKLVDIESESFEDVITTLGIMSLNEDIYSKELKSYPLYNLSCDNNLKHYVVITKGEFTGTVLYNGNRKFIDSKKRYYFGVGLFEQL